MAQQVIDTSGSSDSLKSGGDKINANFGELYGVTGLGNVMALIEQANAAWSAALAANPDLNPSFCMNPSTINADTTIPAGFNAQSVGPLTVGEGINITVADTANWTVI